MEYDWGEIRNQLDEIAEEYADYSEDYYAELELWKQPTIEFEEWLSENRGIGFEQEREIYYDLKKTGSNYSFISRCTNSHGVV